MEIDLNMLSIVIKKTVQDYLGELNITSITVDQDYYWEIMAPERYDFTTKPSELVVGQITEDWEILNEIGTGEKEPIAYNLVQLASLIRAIGEIGEYRLYKQGLDKTSEPN